MVVGSHCASACVLEMRFPTCFRRAGELVPSRSRMQREEGKSPLETQHVPGRARTAVGVSPGFPPPAGTAAWFPFPCLTWLFLGLLVLAALSRSGWETGRNAARQRMGQPRSLSFNQGPFLPTPGRQASIWVPICREMERY